MSNKQIDALEQIRNEVMKHTIIPECIKESFDTIKTPSGKVIIKKKST